MQHKLSPDNHLMPIYFVWDTFKMCYVVKAGKVELATTPYVEIAVALVAQAQARVIQ